jgi:hypothetical protein
MRDTTAKSNGGQKDVDESTALVKKLGEGAELGERTEEAVRLRDPFVSVARRGGKSVRGGKQRRRIGGDDGARTR